jgi:hypothetical protein
MPGLFRMLLWTAVLVAPGGLLLAPVLVAQAARRRHKSEI